MLKLSTAANYRIAFALIVGFQAILMAYAPLYFKGLGYSPFEISLISGLENLAGFVGPAILVARSYPKGLGLTILSGISGLLLGLNTPALGAVMIVIWTISLILSRATFVMVNEGALLKDKEGLLNYSESRSWGSVSFLVVMYVVGIFVEQFGIACIMLVGAIMLLSLSLIGLNIREQIEDTAPKGVIDFLRESFFAWHWIFFISIIFIWASHGPAYAFLSLHLTNLGWSPTEIGLVWNVSVLSEIFLFLIFKRIEKYFTLETYLIFAQVAAVFRWIILSTTTNSVVLITSQVLHAFTFGLCFVVNQKLLERSVSKEYRKPAFALYFGITLGAGSLLGKLVAGWSTNYSSFHGDFSQSFFLGAVLALISLILWAFRQKMPSSQSMQLPSV